MFKGGLAKDLTVLGDAAHQPTLTARVPMDSIVIAKPDDGAPSIDDWITTLVSFVFSGSRLEREPLDVCLAPGVMPSSENHKPFLVIKKGFTRLNLGKWACLQVFRLKSLTNYPVKSGGFSKTK